VNVRSGAVERAEVMPARRGERCRDGARPRRARSRRDRPCSGSRTARRRTRAQRGPRCVRGSRGRTASRRAPASRPTERSSAPDRRRRTRRRARHAGRARAARRPSRARPTSPTSAPRSRRPSRRADRARATRDALARPGCSRPPAGSSQPKPLRSTRDHAVASRERRNHRGPALARGAIPVNEHDRGSMADIAVADVDAVDLDERRIGRRTGQAAIVKPRAAAERKGQAEPHRTRARPASPPANTSCRRARHAGPPTRARWSRPSRARSGRPSDSRRADVERRHPIEDVDVGHPRAVDGRRAHGASLLISAGRRTPCRPRSLATRRSRRIRSTPRSTRTIASSGGWRDLACARGRSRHAARGTRRRASSSSRLDRRATDTSRYTR